MYVYICIGRDVSSSSDLGASWSDLEGNLGGILQAYCILSQTQIIIKYIDMHIYIYICEYIYLGRDRYLLQVAL